MQQRPIKFRAWDGTKYRYVFWLGSDDGVSMLGDNEYPEWMLEQFTGLLDAAGAEIYEGDILRRVNPPTASRHTGQTIKNGHGAAFLVAWLNNIQKNGFNVAKGESYVIVGNIHTTPDLIEPGAATQEK
jgi:hypothetical protein